MENQNAYSVLGLRKGVAEENIKQAYVELVKQFDPEKHAERFMVIQAAYENLRDPVRRAREDILTFNHIPGRFLFTADEQTKDAQADVGQHVHACAERYAANPKDLAVQKAYLKGLMQLSFKKVGKRLWAEAIEDWTKILEIDPVHQRAKNNLLNAYLTLGYSYADHGLDNEARDMWEKAQHMNPDDEALIHNLAIASELSGKDDEARRYWGEVLRRWQARIDADPDDDYTRNCIIEVRRHHGGQAIEGASGPASIEEYREILKINPDDFEAQYKIATAMMEERNWPEANQALQNLLRKHPKNIEVMNLLGWAYLNSGRIEEAFRAWNRSLALDPKNFSTREALVKGRMQMGRAFREKGIHTQSLVHFKALLRLTPNSPEVYMEIGQTYMLKGDKRSAATAFQRVLTLDPKNKAARQNLSGMKLRA